MEIFISRNEMAEKQLSKGRIALLRRLFRDKRIGGRNLPEALCLRWIRHLPKEEHRAAVKDWEECIHEGLVLTKPKPSGRYIFLNPRRVKEILKLLEGEEK